MSFPTLSLEQLASTLGGEQASQPKQASIHSPPTIPRPPIVDGGPNYLPPACSGRENCRLVNRVWDLPRQGMTP
jgi:hypothetical protein